MFTQLIYLILFLLIVNLAPEAQAGHWSEDPLVGLSDGLLLYAALLLWIAIQNSTLGRRFTHLRSFLTPIVQAEILLFFLAYHFVFVSHRLYMDFPNTLFSLISLLMYFGALGVHHATYYSRAGLIFRKQTRLRFAGVQLRFLVPFILPFIAFELLFDLLNSIPYEPLQRLIRHEGSPLMESLLFVGLTLFFLIVMLIFLPALIQRLWGCTSLNNPELEERLERLCHRAGFSHAGMKRWTILRSSHTAAIIGIVSRFRYVMFTDGLIERLTEKEIEAVLAHEIGHSYRKHLLLYPFVIFGLVISSGLFSLFFLDALFSHFALREYLGSPELWEALRPLAVFVPYGIIAVAYFRLVFGFFSRNFERQADLHPVHLGLEHTHIISALHSVAVASGEPIDKPNWHHYSIRERMGYLNAVSEQPELAGQHHRRVRRILYLYFTLLILTLGVLTAPLLHSIPGFRTVASGVEKIQLRIDNWSNTGVRKQVARHMVEGYALEGDLPLIQLTLEKSLKEPSAIYLSGLAELFASQDLSYADEHKAALKLMGFAWLRFNFEGMPEAVLEDFERNTQQLLKAAGEEEIYRQEIQFLLDSRDYAIQNKSIHSKTQIEFSHAQSIVFSRPTQRLLRRT